MPAKTPEEICNLFKQHMAAGDVESLLSLDDSEVVFLNQSGEARRGKKEFREELAPFAVASTFRYFKVDEVIQTGDIALDSGAYAGKVSGAYEHRTIHGGVGHNLPQEAPEAFAKAMVDVGGR